MAKYEMQRLLVCLFGLLILCGWPNASARKPSEITPESAAKLSRVVTQLNNALRTLKAEPINRIEVSNVESAMKKIATHIGAYFHSRNQNKDEVRVSYLRLRNVVHSLRGGKQPVLVFVHGIAHFHRRVHSQLVQSHGLLGQTRQQIKHVRAILAADPKDENSKALLAQLEASRAP